MGARFPDVFFVGISELSGRSFVNAKLRRGEPVPAWRRVAAPYGRTPLDMVRIAGSRPSLAAQTSRLAGPRAAELSAKTVGEGGD
jgi:hypothetical protein